MEVACVTRDRVSGLVWTPEDLFDSVVDLPAVAFPHLANGHIAISQMTLQSQGSSALTH